MRGRDCGGKILAVRFCQHSRVENAYNTAVACASNQPAYALPEFDYRGGQRYFHKGILPQRFGALHSRLGERVLKILKRQPHDYNLRKRVGGHVDSRPKSVGSHENCGCVLGKTAYRFGARHAPLNI